MARPLLVLAVAVLLLLLCGCSPRIDSDQGRLCRIALVAVFDTPPTIRLLRQSPLPADASGPGVRILIAIPAEAGRQQVRTADCRFRDGAHPAGPDDLVSFASEDGPLAAPNLLFLKRFWLATPEGLAADPEPVASGASAPFVPLPVAHALQNALNALPAMATYALLSVAYSLVYGLVNRINLAFGEMAAVGAAASLVAVGFYAGPWGLGLIIFSLVVAVCATALHGVAIARVVFQPLRGATGQQGLVATIGLALVLNEYLRLAQGPTPLWIPPLGTTPMAVARSGEFIVTVTPLAFELAGGFAVVALGVLTLMAWTQFGRNWRALSDDPRAAALLGVSPALILFETFALASALAGAAGAVVVLVYGSFGASYGLVLGLKGLLGAVLGGIGSIRGALIGGVVIGALEALWSAFFPVETRDLMLFTLLVVCLIVRPGGFFGFRDLGPRPV